MTRTCPKCKIEKPAEAFGINRATKSGLTCYCKACTKAPPRTGTCDRCGEDFTYTARNGVAQRLCHECNATHKRCSWCREIRPKDDYRSNQANWDGKNTYCTPCIVSPEGRRRARKHNMQVRWKLTSEEYDAFIAAACDCCGRTDAKRMCIDHDHLTGQVRGRLCVSCNTAIGKLGDNVAGLQRAIDYLERAAAAWEERAA